jgi:hypothetical protein
MLTHKVRYGGCQQREVRVFSLIASDSSNACDVCSPSS